MRRKLLPLVAVSLILLGAQPSLALTLSEVRTAIRRNVRDTASSTTLRRYSDTVLNAFINEAQRAVINDTWALSETSVVSLSSGTSGYSVSSLMIVPHRVQLSSLNGATLPELSTTQLDADFNNADWGSTTAATPTHFYRLKQSPGYIYVYPTPSATGQNVRVDYYKRAADLSSDSDVPFDSNTELYSYHDLLVYHVSYRLLVQENRVAEADQYKDVYNGGVEIMNENVGHKPVRPVKPSTETKP